MTLDIIALSVMQANLLIWLNNLELFVVCLVAFAVVLPLIDE